VVKREFGGWRKALDMLNEHLRSKGLVLVQRKGPYNQLYTDDELFKEMERIWSKLGHRPSRTEWELENPKCSYGTYKHRFHGWANACLKFIEYKMGDTIIDEPPPLRLPRRVKKQNPVMSLVIPGPSLTDCE